VNQTELLASIFKGLPNHIELSRQSLKTIVSVIFEQIGESLIIGQPVSVPGFGIFKVKEVAARQGRNPSTGEPLEIAAHRKVTFTPAKSFKEKINDSKKD
jgi:DNA-binding protein HU-beta